MALIEHSKQVCLLLQVCAEAANATLINPRSPRCICSVLTDWCSSARRGASTEILPVWPLTLSKLTALKSSATVGSWVWTLNGHSATQPIFQLSAGARPLGCAPGRIHSDSLQLLCQISAIYSRQPPKISITPRDAHLVLSVRPEQKVYMLQREIVTKKSFWPV